MAGAWGGDLRCDFEGSLDFHSSLDVKDPRSRERRCAPQVRGPQRGALWPKESCCSRGISPSFPRKLLKFNTVSHTFPHEVRVPMDIDVAKARFARR